MTKSIALSIAEKLELDQNTVELVLAKYMETIVYKILFDKDVDTVFGKLSFENDKIILKEGSQKLERLLKSNYSLERLEAEILTLLVEI